MPTVVEMPCLRLCARVAVLGVFAAGLAGCSSDTSRFGESAFSNPFSSSNSRASDVTGSVPAAQPAPVGRVESRPLQHSAVQPQPLPPPPTSGRPPTQAAAFGQAGGGRGIGSYAPPPSPLPSPPVLSAPAATSADITGTIQKPRPVVASAAPPAAPAAQSGWNWDGGTAVVVGPNEDLASLSRKYGVPGSAILQANGFANAAAVRAGQRIVIPRYNQPQMAAAKPAPVPAPPRLNAPPASGYVHVVAPGETLTSISKRYQKPLTAIASANKIPPHTHVKFGDRIIIPGRVTAGMAKTASAAPKPVAAAQPAPTLNRPQAAAPAPQLASAQPTPTARVVTPAAEALADDGGAVGSTGGTSFRWPVRGRVIAGFGAKPNGQQNDGINLAVPEGTVVRASDDGVVAYAGNELKGYGNLILIRHANGYVTAYAHASEIMVKRNDQVRRGQVIAKSGQSGTVSTPQLHFEIRKGSTPVDPLQYLPAA